MPPSVDLDRRSSRSEYNLDDTGKSIDSHAISTVGRSIVEEERMHGVPGLESDRSAYGSDFFDPNIDSDADVDGEDSPYPEVRSAVANVDDDTIPVSTIRSWSIGIVTSIIIPGLNQFFHFRYPSVMIAGLVAMLVVFPLGRAWARVVPQVTILGVPLNPGPFSIKEHVLITIMASVGAQSAYAADIVAVQRVYYNQNFSFAYQWMLVMSTQMIGFSIGGFTRRFLVTPPAMIWPNTLVTCAVFNTLHSQSLRYDGRSSLSRERFFVYVFSGACLWYFFPGYIFTGLGFFDWVCWIAPKNVNIGQFFGYRYGLGFSVLTFDWNQIAFIGSPLATPWWAEANVAVGFVVFYWTVTPILYYTNVWYSQYMPISSRASYDNTGAPYNISRILNPDTTLNVEAYKAYSPLFLSTLFAMSYGLSFMAIAATITHAAIHFWRPIKVHLWRSLQEEPDIHSRLMSKYLQVPDWWYAAIFVVTFAFACVSIKVWPTEMTIWALIVALLLALVYIVPIGMIQAITNRQIGLNVISELVVGFMLPGRPVALMMFKTWGYISVSQAMQFTGDLKLGHYMKIPPRHVFLCQVVATAIAGTVQLLVQSWMFTNIPDLCSPGQKDGFICAGTEVFATASVLWGVIGPAALFAKGQCASLTHGNFCSILSFFFLIGAACPVLMWLVTRRYPSTFLNYLNFPLIFAGTGLLPESSPINYVSWVLVGFVFQYLIRRRHFSFWAKYNYVLSAALDAGTAVGVILVYFCLQYPVHGTIGEKNIGTWWGNTVYQKTAAWEGTPVKTVAKGDTFGPRTW
ncbi:hypothetical protein PLICRDRAFT_701048 [Plicaturopsis crispa FD-325 SS-3]|nr:hypothetical protein PLICRDRAFT_701048 [Plicaturopsis crispa FD-325 SS-3]